MEYICTICCKDKREDNEFLPATQRYISKRILLSFPGWGCYNKRIEFVFREGED